MSLSFFLSILVPIVIAIASFFYGIIKSNNRAHLAIQKEFRAEITELKNTNTTSHAEIWKEINSTKTQVAVNDQQTKDNKDEIERLRNKINGG